MLGHAQWRWRHDEVYVRRNAEMRRLWRTVDQERRLISRETRLDRSGRVEGPHGPGRI